MQLPDIRIPGTFWSSHPPKYELLQQQQVTLLKSHNRLTSRNMQLVAKERVYLIPVATRIVLLASLPNVFFEAHVTLSVRMMEYVNIT